MKPSSCDGKFPGAQDIGSAGQTHGLAVQTSQDYRKVSMEGVLGGCDPPRTMETSAAQGEGRAYGVWWMVAAETTVTSNV